VVRNPGDWTVEQFFEQVGALDASDRRFGLFLEGLAAADVRPDEESQRAFVAAVNGALASSGVELREIGRDGGFPTFRLARTGRGAGPAKNLIFASRTKPDLRFRDAVNNDVEIVSGADDVLVYDLPFPDHGLRWSDLQAWWSRSAGIEGDAAKQGLYRRLLKSLPENSPQQVLLFKTYFRHFGPRIPVLPALLPEVWLHWDPKTVRERGPEALARFRMDFLLLLPGETRIVLEVDGKHHYSSDSGAGDPKRYAAQVRADRDLRLCGYDVYRFGEYEFRDEQLAPKMLAEFFDELFRRHRLLT
jgi:very-short-patch-repair endonuclease